MTLLQTIVLSIIEGLTEFLPISSTGHLVLASHLLQIPQTNFLKSFEIIIQLGAIMAVVTIYLDKITSSPKLLFKLLTAFIPTGIIGFLLYPFIRHLLDKPIVSVGSLFLGGIVLLFVDKVFYSPRTETTNLKTPKLLFIGLFQSLSLIPGISRSAASIIGGQLVGLSRQNAVEFSFLLALPTMFAATGLDILKSQLEFNSHELLLLFFGCVISFITATIAIKSFVKYISRHSFFVFGLYRIFISVAYLLLVSRF